MSDSQRETSSSPEDRVEDLAPLDEQADNLQGGRIRSGGGSMKAAGGLELPPLRK